MNAWDWFWLLFIFVPLSIIWFLVLADAIRRPDLVGWQKGLWVALIVFFPWLGALAYLITKPANPLASPSMGGMPQSSAPLAAPTPTPTRVAPEASPTSS
jgi:Phospholipase_D-nuclease N-terminal